MFQVLQLKLSEKSMPTKMKKSIFLSGSHSKKKITLLNPGAVLSIRVKAGIGMSIGTATATRANTAIISDTGTIAVIIIGTIVGTGIIIQRIGGLVAAACEGALP